MGAGQGRSLGAILLERGALAQEDHSLLEALCQRQIARYGNAQRSLQGASLAGVVRSALAGVLDLDVQASIARFGHSQEDPGKTVWTTQSYQGEAADRRFQVLRPHAKGGLGEVFVAKDRELHREVALKEIQSKYSQDSNSRGRFLLEAEITGRLEHPGIVPVYGLGIYSDGRPYYAMRFIRGDNLKEAIERFHLSQEGFDSVAFRRLLGRFLDVCNAVAYAHSRGILHEDLKPGNEMLGKFGETLVVDWGLAKVIGMQGDSEGESLDGETTLQPALSSPRPADA